LAFRPAGGQVEYQVGIELACASEWAALAAIFPAGAVSGLRYTEESMKHLNR